MFPLVKTLMENPVFRVLVLSLVVYSSQKDPKIAIMIAIAFTVTLHILNERDIEESFYQ
jgi:hypothetical protein